ncbi:MAG: hypothetical protein ABW186_06855, partial [Rhodanobacteraceae bacterium]
MVLTLLLAFATPLQAAASNKAEFTKGPIPARLRDAIHQTLGADQWTQTQQVTQTDPAFDPEFGYAVAVHGTTAMIGAQQAKIGDNDAQGAVYVYEQG